MPTPDEVWVVRDIAYDYGDCETLLSIHAALEGAMEHYRPGQPWEWQQSWPNDDSEYHDRWHRITREKVIPFES